MVNPRFLELAKRLGNKDLPKEETAKITPKRQQGILLDPSSTLQESFILTYDTEFAQELIRKSNELFAGTKAEIPLKDSGEVPNMYILKRLALITAIYKDPQLQSYGGLLPITPLQSEQLLKDGNLHPEKYWEDLALILYDTKGTNKNEAQALYESLRNHKDSLNLSQSGLETIVLLDSKLLVVNAGIEKDSDMPNGVKPIVLPGLTQVYAHPTLEKTGSNHNFEYGLERGLPAENELGNGSRTLYMPSDEDIGLRVLCRDEGLSLNAWYGDLVSSSSYGRVNFARQGVAK